MSTKAARAEIIQQLIQYGLIDSPEEYLAVLVRAEETINMKKWVRDTKLARKMYKYIDDEHNGHLLVGENTPVKGSEHCLVCSPKRVEDCWRFILDNEDYREYNVHSTTYVHDETVYAMNSNIMPLTNISHLINKESE